MKGKNIAVLLIFHLSIPNNDHLMCYVGQTGRHLITRMKEHKRSGPVGNHLKDCNVELPMDMVDIKAKTNKSTSFLMTLEALIIDKIKPVLNTKDEYRSRALTIKL